MMFKKLFIGVTLCSLVGCSGMIDKISHMETISVSFPAKQHYTVSCLETAATRHNYFLEKTDHIGSIDRYTLRRIGGNPTATLDIQGMSSSTSITLLYDRRDINTTNDIEGILGYCKKYIG